jgi:hypothetical protein
VKYTLISKTGKVADLLVTLEDALPVLRARHGDNGRAIILELLDLVEQERTRASCNEHTMHCEKPQWWWDAIRNGDTRVARLQWWGLGKLLDDNE